MEIRFEKFDKETSIDQQRKLFIECFPENIGSPVETVNHYNWKFHSIPGDIKSFEYSANSEDDIIGYYAAIPYKYTFNDQHLTAGMVCDVMTGIKARGKGVFTKLGRYSIDQFKTNGIDFTTGYPIRPEVIPGHKKVGWEFPFELPMYGKFLSLKTFLKSRNLSFLSFIGDFLILVINTLISFFRSPNREVNIEKYNSKSIDSILGFDDFTEKLSKETPIYLKKDLNFLKWRLGAPDKNYSIIILRKNNEIIAYSIARPVIKENVQCYGILDFVTLKGYEKYSSVLLRENEIQAKNNNAELLLTMISEKKAGKYKFLQNGYLKTPYKFSFIINKLNNAIDSKVLFDVNNWHLMWIDSDDL